MRTGRPADPIFLEQRKLGISKKQFIPRQQWEQMTPLARRILARIMTHKTKGEENAK